MLRINYLFILLLAAILSLPAIAQVDPDTAMNASIDRFSMDAGHLFVRDSSNGLPDPVESLPAY